MTSLGESIMVETLVSAVGISWGYYIGIFLGISNCVSASIAEGIAKRKGRRTVAWFFMGLCYGPIAVVLVYCAEPGK